MDWITLLFIFISCWGVGCVAIIILQPHLIGPRKTKFDKDPMFETIIPGKRYYLSIDEPDMWVYINRQKKKFRRATYVAQFHMLDYPNGYFMLMPYRTITYKTADEAYDDIKKAVEE